MTMNDGMVALGASAWDNAKQEEDVFVLYHVSYDHIGLSNGGNPDAPFGPLVFASREQAEKYLQQLRQHDQAWVEDEEITIWNITMRQLLNEERNGADWRYLYTLRDDGKGNFIVAAVPLPPEEACGEAAKG